MPVSRLSLLAIYVWGFIISLMGKKVEGLNSIFSPILLLSPSSPNMAKVMHPTCHPSFFFICLPTLCTVQRTWRSLVQPDEMLLIVLFCRVSMWLTYCLSLKLTRIHSLHVAVENTNFSGQFIPWTAFQSSVFNSDTKNTNERNFMLSVCSSLYPHQALSHLRKKRCPKSWKLTGISQRQLWPSMSWPFIPVMPGILLDL